MAHKPSGSEEAVPGNDSDDDIAAQESKMLIQVELPPLSESAPHAWNDVNEKQLRSALIGACKRMPRNAEAHFHLGLMYMRKCDGEDALRAFQHCKQIYNERLEQYNAQNKDPPPQLLSNIARLRSHTAQAAHLAASSKYEREERAPFLARLHRDLVAATNLDSSQPDVWNALALLHLNEGGFEGAREVLRSIRGSCPEYLDALNNLGLAELALGNEEAAISCFQKVILVDKGHAEALSNYGVVLLRHGLYDAAIHAFNGAVRGSTSRGRGLAFAWGGLAVARAAVGMLEEAEQAAEEAERTADPPNRAKFTMLMISVRARKVTSELRKGLASYVSPRQTLGDSDGTVPGIRAEESQPGSSSPRDKQDPRPAMDSAVLRLRALAREIKSSSASTALGAVLRLRHEYSWEESGNRNFGAEAAERLVEALECDESDAPAWVQLSLLQMGTGEYASARDFAVQAVSRTSKFEAGWNALAVASQLSDDVGQAQKAYEKAIQLVKSKYDKDAKNGCAVRTGNEITDSDLRDADGEDDVMVSTPDPVMPSEDEGDQKNLETESTTPQLNTAGLNALAALYNNIGNLKRQEGRSFSEALNAYNMSLKLGGESAIVYNNIALLYISAGRFEDATGMLVHALKLDPQLECAVSNRLKLKAFIRQKELGKLKQNDESDRFDTEVDL